MTISKKIEAAVTALNAKKDELSVLVNKAADGETVDVSVLEALNKGIQADEQLIASMKASEQLLAKAASPAFIKNTGDRGDYTFEKHAIAVMKARIETKPVEVAAAELYGDTSAVSEVLKADNLTVGVTANGQLAATTTQQGWASQLVRDQYLGYIDALRAKAVLPAIVAKGGMNLNFDNTNKLILPMFGTTGGLAGSWVSEGGAIPVKKGALTSKNFTPCKAGVISVFTKEIVQRSNPAIEGIVREQIIKDTADFLDGAFFSSTAAVANVSPPGAFVGVTNTASTGVTASAYVTDIQSAIGPMLAANIGERLVVVMKPQLHMQLQLLQNAVGNFVFASELASGRLLGMDVIVSNNAPAGMTVIDAAQWAFGVGAPSFATSDSAALQMASPVAGTETFYSLFQTESIALRMTMPVAWDFIRAGSVATIK